MRLSVWKRSLWLAWAFVWLFGWFSVDLIHSHDEADHHKHHTACLVCHLDHHSPLAPEVAFVSAAPAALHFSAEPSRILSEAAPLGTANNEPFIPRGPPA